MEVMYGMVGLKDSHGEEDCVLYRCIGVYASMR